MIRRPPRSTLSSSSAASDVYKRQGLVLQRGRRYRSNFLLACRGAKGPHQLQLLHLVLTGQPVTLLLVPEYTCIESINANLETRSESGKRSRGVEQYLKALREVGRGSREEPRATKARQVVSKRARCSTSTADPCNTPLPEYVPNYVFSPLTVFFRCTFRI